MPQGLPKKIEVGLLLPDLALELGDPTSRRRSFIEDRTPERWAIQPALARTADTSQRFQPTLPPRPPPGSPPFASTLPIRTLVASSVPLQRNCPEFYCLTFGVHSTVE